jgi:hypothetical protein
MVFGRLRLADDGIASLRTGHLSVVPCLAAAVPPVGVNASGHHLDGEHLPDLLRLASSRDGATMVASWLDHDSGIRSHGNRWGNHRFAPDHTPGNIPIFDGLASKLYNARPTGKRDMKGWRGRW